MILSAKIQSPPSGAITGFNSMYSLFTAVPESLKAFGKACKTDQYEQQKSHPTPLYFLGKSTSFPFFWLIGDQPIRQFLRITSHMQSR
jgi:hypothetical protein